MPIRIYLVEAGTLLSAGLRASLAAMPEGTLVGGTADRVGARGEIDRISPEVVVVDDGIGAPALEELMRQLASLPRQPRILVVGEDPDGDGALRALKAGAAGYLPAACDAAKLFEAIRGISRGELVFRPEQVTKILGPLRPTIGGERDPVMVLSERERQVFRLTGHGLEAKEIARRLHLSARTVDVHRANIRNKLAISGPHELMRYAMIWEENERLAIQMQAFCGAREPLLLVEDDDVDVLSVKRALKEMRAETQVVVVAHGEEALVYLRKPSNPRPFLILLDINLPRMNGPEFLAELRRDPVLAPLPVVVLTSSQHEADKDRIYRLGVTGYFVKPASSQEFVKLFRSLAQYWGSNARPSLA